MDRLERGIGQYFAMAFQWGHDFSAMDRLWSNPEPDHRRDEFQWGHDFSAMDRQVADDIPTAYGEFQWGHDFSAMDSSAAPNSSIVGILCFNGATTFQPWIGGNTAKSTL